MGNKKFAEKNFCHTPSQHGFTAAPGQLSLSNIVQSLSY